MDWLVSGCCKLWNISNNIRMNSLQCCNFTQGKRKLNLCDRSFTVLLYYEDLSIRWMWLLLKYFNASLTIDNLYFLQLLCRPPKANKMNFGFSVSIYAAYLKDDSNVMLFYCLCNVQEGNIYIFVCWEYFL